jgi:hypothetical protein
MWGSLRVEVSGDEIIVTQRGSKFRVVYRKSEDQPQLVVKGTPHGNYDFFGPRMAGGQRQGARTGVDRVSAPGDAARYPSGHCRLPRQPHIAEPTSIRATRINTVVIIVISP